jgi:hypothetical protein
MPVTLSLPIFLAFSSSCLYDDFSLWSSVPMLIGSAILVTLVYTKARALTVPLWFSKQISRVGVFVVLAQLFVGYTMLLRNMYVQEASVVFRNI